MWNMQDDRHRAIYAYTQEIMEAYGNYTEEKIEHDRRGQEIELRLERRLEQARRSLIENLKG